VPWDGIRLSQAPDGAPLGYADTAANKVAPNRIVRNISGVITRVFGKSCLSQRISATDTILPWEDIFIP